MNATNAIHVATVTIKVIM